MWQRARMWAGNEEWGPLRETFLWVLVGPPFPCPFIPGRWGLTTHLLLDMNPGEGEARFVAFSDRLELIAEFCETPPVETYEDHAKKVWGAIGHQQRTY
jgi:hypothetical protein